MTSPPNSRTSSTPKNNKLPRGSPISKHPYVTCHIVCQPRPLPPCPPGSGPPPTEKAPTPPNCRTPPCKEGKREGKGTTHTSLSRG